MEGKFEHFRIYLVLICFLLQPPLLLHKHSQLFDYCYQCNLI